MGYGDTIAVGNLLAAIDDWFSAHQAQQGEDNA